MEIEITGHHTVCDVPCVVFRMPTDVDGSLKVVEAMRSLFDDLGGTVTLPRADACCMCPGYNRVDAPCRIRACPVPVTKFIMRVEYVPLLQLRGLTVRSSHD